MVPSVNVGRDVRSSSLMEKKRAPFGLQLHTSRFNWICGQLCQLQRWFMACGTHGPQFGATCKWTPMGRGDVSALHIFIAQVVRGRSGWSVFPLLYF